MGGGYFHSCVTHRCVTRREIYIVTRAVTALLSRLLNQQPNRLISPKMAILRRVLRYLWTITGTFCYYNRYNTTLLEVSNSWFSRDVRKKLKLRILSFKHIFGVCFFLLNNTFSPRLCIFIH